MTKYIGILFSLMTGFFASAQKPYVELIVQPTEVEVGQAFNVIVKSNISGDINIDYPAGFEQGYSVMNSMEQEFDGNTGEVITYYFHGRTGTLTKEGKFSIGPAFVRKGNKVYKSNKVQVIAKPKGCGMNESIDATLFKKPACGSIVLSKDKVYVGEAVVIESKVTSRFKPTHYDSYQGYIIASGADQHKINGPQEVLVRNENKNNKERFVFELDKQVVFFNNPGKVKIDPFEMTLQSGFDGFELTSKKNDIRVVPLPKNAPQWFTGGVGQFDVKCVVNKSDLKQGEIVTLTLELSGYGNLHDISDPKLNLPKELQLYGDPERKEKFSFTDKGADGTITIYYHLRVLESGSITIPAVKFAYFDPQQEKYVTKTTRSNSLSVENDPSFVVADNTQSEYGAGNTIERFDTNETASSGFFSNPVVKWVGISTPLCLAFLFFFARARKQKESTKETVTNKQLAENQVEKINPDEWLSLLAPHVANQNTIPFFTQLSKYLQNSVSQAARGDINWVLSKDEIKIFFDQKNLDTDFQNEFFNLQQTCELSRYGCQVPTDNLESYAAKAQSIFYRLDSITS
ncbi:MAG: BatD family protein [Crocinitomicaceae bacterium]